MRRLRAAPGPAPSPAPSPAAPLPPAAGGREPGGPRSALGCARGWGCGGWGGAVRGAGGLQEGPGGLQGGAALLREEGGCGCVRGRSGKGTAREGDPATRCIPGDVLHGLSAFEGCPERLFKINRREKASRCSFTWDRRELWASEPSSHIFSHESVRSPPFARTRAGRAQPASPQHTAATRWDIPREVTASTARLARTPRTTPSSYKPCLQEDRTAGWLTLTARSALNPISVFLAAKTQPAWPRPSHVTHSCPGTHPCRVHLCGEQAARSESNPPLLGWGEINPPFLV